MDKILQPWAQETNEVFSALATKNEGLTESEAKLRLATFGKNIFSVKEKKSAVSIFLKQFVSPLIFILLGASALTLSLGEIIDTFVILFAVVLNVSLGFYHEYNAENTLEKLTTYIKDRARVIREGREEEIDSALLVPGDLIKLSYGTRIPADTRIITINNLRVDEAILTGESLPVEKSDDKVQLTAIVAERKNIAHAGTLVVEGYAKGIVYATGNSTEIGKIASVVSKISRVETPLQRGVNKLAWLIFGLVILIVAGIFILGISRGEPIVPMLVLSSAVAVGAVPEALPIVLTVILAIGATHIAARKGIVRKLTAAETLGSTTLILTDKTGTLTLADMRLVGIHSVEDIRAGRGEEKIFSHDDKKLLELALLNVDVTVENQRDAMSDWRFIGRPFEVNIVKAAREHKIALDNIFTENSSLVLPFNSTNKFSVAQAGKKYALMGAPEILLNKSNFNIEREKEILDFIDKKSREGQRLIGLAEVDANGEKFALNEVQNITFLGILAFYDPIRKEVPAAIKNIESHGMKMALVTGDLVGTAIAVARELGWQVSDEEVITGAELRVLSDDELRVVVSKIKIFARVTPEDKLRIGQAYQALGEVVAMTGDGVNDAPALKAMDMGISLGSGSDVAKAAADLVLLDDNFETISHAIDEGRRILSNIRKSFVYLMSNSLDEVFVVGGSLLFGLAVPITALQIIWVNLFTGSLPAIAFAFDENMDRERYTGKNLKLIFTNEVKILTFGIGILSSLLLFILYYFLSTLGLDIATTRSIFFVCFSSYILAITYSFRSLKKPITLYNPFSNSKLNYSLVLSALILVLTMTVPFIREILHIAPLPLTWLPFVVLWLILNILLVEFAKFVIRKKHFIRSLLHPARAK